MEPNDEIQEQRQRAEEDFKKELIKNIKGSSSE
jgi:hypothetical protein